MSQRRIVFIGALAIAGITAACSTDAGIGTKVKANLAADETVKSAPVNVAVDKKIVTLSGTVDTADVKERAVADARKADGVADVVDQIAVKEQQSPGPGPGMGHDAMERGMKMEGKEHSGNMPKSQ